MAKLRYVDWDGLVYYDGKIKKYVDDKLEEVIKVGKSVTFDELPDPSFQNINYIYKVTDSFTSNTRFEEQGLMYPAGTVVLVSNINDVYLYTIFYEPINGSDVDLTTLLDRLERLESDVVQLNQTVSDLDNNVSDVEGTIQALQGQIDTIEQNYATEDFVNDKIVQTTGDSETTVMSQKAVSNALGDVETALDEIIAIQNTLIGG